MCCLRIEPRKPQNSGYGTTRARIIILISAPLPSLKVRHSAGPVQPAPSHPQTQPGAVPYVTPGRTEREEHLKGTVHPSLSVLIVGTPFHELQVMSTRGIPLVFQSCSYSIPLRYTSEANTASTGVQLASPGGRTGTARSKGTLLIREIDSRATGYPSLLLRAFDFDHRPCQVLIASLQPRPPFARVQEGTTC